MDGDRDDIIVLIDENGKEVEAEYIDTIEYHNNDYVVLLPMDGYDEADEDGDGDKNAHKHNHGDGECDCEEEEVIILKVEPGADGEDETFVAIEDEAEQEAVFEIFTQRLYEETEEDDGEDE